MYRLSDKELNQIMQIGSLAQECASDGDFAQIMSEEMLKLFNSRSSVFIECSPDGAGAQMTNALSYKIDPVHSQNYSEHYHKLDPCFNQFGKIFDRVAIPSVSTDQVISDTASYVNSEYYQDFMLSTGVHHSIIFGLKNSEKTYGLVGLHRTCKQHKYSEEDHTKVRLIAPYLSTALMYREKVEHLASQHSIMHGFLKSSNVQAYLLMDDKFNCVDYGGDLEFLCSTSSVSIVENQSALSFLPHKIINYVRDVNASTVLQQQSLHTVDDIDNFPKTRIEFFRNAHQQLFVLIFFLQNQKSLISKERMEYFELTSRQVDIVRLVELGFTNPEISKALGISSKTVENHLTQIYSKTGTHNKTSLILQLSDCH